MEPIASNLPLVEVLGEAECPKAGCTNTGRLVRVGVTQIVETCPPCQDAYDEWQQAEERAALIRAALDRAGATAVYMDWSLASYPADGPSGKALLMATQWIDEYLGGKRRNVLLYGPQGGGKTGLAWSVIRHLVEAYAVECKLVAWREALDVMRDAFRFKDMPPQMTILKTVPVLVLDDVGSERPTDFARGELLSLVDHRMLNKRPTWYTSNFEPDKLADRLGHDDPIIGRRIVSRMAGSAMQFRLDVPDRRMAA